MPPISNTKKEKISEQILHHLFSISPEAHFTNKIAQEIARDEEFTKTLLQDLKKKNLVNEVNKSPKGGNYIRRQRWRISPSAFEAYSKHQ
jgi:DNA-binding IscR family transcriptional regulator